MPIDTGGRNYPVQLSPGVAPSDFLTGGAFSVLSAPAGSQEDTSLTAVATTNPAFSMPQGSPTYWLVGLVGLAVAMHLIHRESRRRLGKPIGTAEDLIGINVWNFLNVTLLAAVGILTLKVGANKYAAGSTFASVANAI